MFPLNILISNCEYTIAVLGENKQLYRFLYASQVPVLNVAMTRFARLGV